MKQSIQQFINPHARVLRFLGIGIVNTLVGYSIYAFLIFTGVPYLGALVLSTIAGVIFNYFSTGHFVFRSERDWTKFWKFVSAYTAVYVANAALLTALIKLLGLNSYIAQIACLPVSVVLSWLLMNRWVFQE